MNELDQKFNFNGINIMKPKLLSQLSQFNQRIEGRILPPLILWMLGVPGGLVLILWLFFFRD